MSRVLPARSGTTRATFGDRIWVSVPEAWGAVDYRDDEEDDASRENEGTEK